MFGEDDANTKRQADHEKVQLRSVSNLKFTAVATLFKRREEDRVVVEEDRVCRSWITSRCVDQTIPTTTCLNWKMSLRRRSLPIFLLIQSMYGGRGGMLSNVQSKATQKQSWNAAIDTSISILSRTPTKRTRCDHSGSFSSQTNPSNFVLVPQPTNELADGV